MIAAGTLRRRRLSGVLRDAIAARCRCPQAADSSLRSHARRARELHRKVADLQALREPAVHRCTEEPSAAERDERAHAVGDGEARESDLGEFAAWLDPERIAGNLHRAYAEIGGAGRGAPIDLGAALRDMIAYNGGRPLSCYA